MAKKSSKRPAKQNGTGQPVTKLDLDTAAQIAIEQLWTELRAFVARMLGKKNRLGKTPSDLVQSGVGSLVRSMQRSEVEFHRLEELRSFMFWKVREKIAAHLRHVHRKRRDISRVGAGRSEDLVSNELGPVAAAIAKESVDRIKKILKREKDPLWRAAYGLAIAEGMSAADVLEFLSENFPKAKLMSKRTIERRLQTQRIEVWKELNSPTVPAGKPKKRRPGGEKKKKPDSKTKKLHLTRRHRPTE